MNNPINSHSGKCVAVGKCARTTESKDPSRKDQMSDTRKQVSSSTTKMFCISAKYYFIIMPHF